MSNIQECPEFPYFGASYPDARCIDGYLWDLDKEEDGILIGDGEAPCPFCNVEDYIAVHWGCFFDDDFDCDMATTEQIEEQEQKARELCRKDVLQLHKKYGYTSSKEMGKE